MKIFYQNRNENFSARITVNNTYPSHLHRQIELIYVLEGQIQVTINDQSRIIEAGGLSVCFPGHSHSTKSPADSKAILILFTPEFTPSFFTELTHRSPDMPFLAPQQVTSEITNAIHGLLDCYFSKSDARIAQGYINIVLGNVLGDLKLRTVSSLESVDLCQRITDYMTLNFLNELTLDTLSHELGLSKFYISRIFSNQLHTSFSAYLGKLRAQHAASLLKSTNMSVTDIGFASGFNSSRTFYRTFHNVYDVTPQEYRNSL